ncbi:MAG: TonB-dependent receptor [Candidatus Acidiferrales bacterium]|jgi:iron complex outermembrane receptor protein
MKPHAIARFRVFVELCMSIAILAMLSTGAMAQQSGTAALNGNVLDASGSAVRNATVVVTNESTNQVSKGTSDPQGHFSVTGLVPGRYTVEVSASGFAADTHKGIQVTPDRAEELSISLKIGSVSEVVTVEANDSDSVAAHLAPMDALLDEHSARTEIKPVFIQNFTSPEADFGELVEMAPGTFSVSPNGIGLGQDKTYFRGFPDGDYDIDFDGVPFYDTNTPTHHTWAFFPPPWVGGVDFDRSPGSASTIGPTPFGGSIHLLSPDMQTDPLIQAGVSYGSFNTIFIDGSYDSGGFGSGKKSNLLVDVQRMTSDGYETQNYQIRDAGSLKFVHRFSENNVLTGYSGVVWLDSNTPNSSPTRGQITNYGDTFLLTNDFNAGELNSAGACINPSDCFYPLNYKFYTYHVPTDFEYVDWTKQWGHGWQTDFRPYTLSYYNAQYYDSPKYSTTTGITFTGDPVSATSAVDKLNSYRKYGENFVVSQVSKYGIFRTGLWYEWATTNRYQIPSDPVTRIDTILPNFHENFYTNSYQPFAEYEYHATQRLTITGGFKYSHFSQNLTQFQDNGKTVGCLGGTLVGGTTGTCVGGSASTNHSAGYNSYMPSADANFRLKSNWSIYGQYGTGTIVPPSGVFDVTGANVAILPSPTSVYTFQGGSVYKMKQVTLNVDAYYTHFQNTYSSINDPNNTSEFDQVAQGDAVTKGFEGEATFYLTRGLSFYINGTAGNAKYVSPTIPLVTNKGVVGPNPNYERWVANTPSNTEAFGLTYQQKHFDAGIFDKRVGNMWNDLTLASGATANQIIPIAPFSITNIYFNYVLANHSHFAQTKLRLSVNNLFDNRNIVGVTQSYATTAIYNPGPADLLTLLPGRSITGTITLGYSPHAR